MKPTSSLTRFWLRAAPLLALLVYSALAFYQLALPGLYYDEALDLPQAVQLARGEPVVLMPKDPGVTVLGRTLPLMVIDYVGAVNTYLMTGVFAALGIGWFSIRWFEVAVGAVILALGVRLARGWFGSSTAVVTGLLLAVSPSFLFWSRMGISVTHVMAVASLGSLVLIGRWARGGRQPGRLWLLFAAGLLLGLGVWAKLLFVWWWAALAALHLTVNLERRWFTRAAWARGEIFGAPWQAWGAGALGVLVGAAPLVYYNARTGETLALLQAAWSSPTSYGVNNLDFLANLGARLSQFRVFLDGSYFWYNGGLHANSGALSLYLAAAAMVLYGFGEWTPARRRRGLAVLVVMLVVNVLGAFTVSGIWATHLYILFPFPQMLAALAVVALWRLRPDAAAWAWAGRLAAGVLAITLAYGEARTTWDYHGDLTRPGGPGRFSDAIYALADYLDQNGVAAPAALDWGLEKNIYVLTGGRVQPAEIFGYSAEPDAGFRERVQALLCDGCVFLNVDAAYAVYPREAAFRQIAAEQGYVVAEAETVVFRERSGQPAFFLYRVRDATGAAPR